MDSITENADIHGALVELADACRSMKYTRIVAATKKADEILAIVEAEAAAAGDDSAAPVSDVAILETVGRFLFGPQWKEAMAEAMGVSSRTITRWLSGETTPHESILERAQNILITHRLGLEGVENAVEAAIYGRAGRT